MTLHEQLEKKKKKKKKKKTKNVRWLLRMKIEHFKYEFFYYPILILTLNI